MESLLEALKLYTVCQEARCPNLGDCFLRGTATFLILGDTCTRNCRFCAIKKGKPLPPDEDEPQKVAQAARRLGLNHVVVTSVTRDDLPDGGASHFASTIRNIRALNPGATVEVLVPDFGGRFSSLKKVLEAKPDVFNHNVETVPRLYPLVRPEASYYRSLQLLKLAKEMGALTKSGLMVGLGERREEVNSVMEDMRGVGVDILTLGQYLRPSRKQLEVREYLPPESFGVYKEEALRFGFHYVSSGPFVRSSYQAKEALASISVAKLQTRATDNNEKRESQEELQGIERSGRENPFNSLQFIVRN